jgi:hypothetical protein
MISTMTKVPVQAGFDSLSFGSLDGFRSKSPGKAAPVLSDVNFEKVNLVINREPIVEATSSNKSSTRHSDL